ncbi:hypothetical protein FKM82_000721 [Ascaphus truei]
MQRLVTPNRNAASPTKERRKVSKIQERKSQVRTKWLIGKYFKRVQEGNLSKSSRNARILIILRIFKICLLDHSTKVICVQMDKR